MVGVEVVIMSFEVVFCVDLICKELWVCIVQLQFDQGNYVCVIVVVEEVLQCDLDDFVVDGVLIVVGFCIVNQLLKCLQGCGVLVLDMVCKEVQMLVIMLCIMMGEVILELLVKLKVICVGCCIVLVVCCMIMFVVLVV